MTYAPVTASPLKHSAYHHWLDHQPRLVQKLLRALEAQRHLVIALIVLVLVVLGSIMAMNYWDAYQEKTAAEKYARLPYEGPERQTALEVLAKEFPKTGAGVLSRFQLGRTAFEAKEYDRALEWFEPLTRLHSRRVFIRILAIHNVGAVYEARKKWEDALAQYQEAAMDPANVGAALSFWNMGRMAEMLGRKEDARRWYQTADEKKFGSAVGNQIEERLLWLDLQDPAS